MRNYIILGVIVLTLNNFIYGQGVSINQTGNAANASAILDVSDTTMGLLIPRMTQNQRNNITSPATSLLIYQIDQDSGFYYYDESTTTWYPFLRGGAGTNSGWTTKGNNGTNPSTNFIGTIDSVDWIIRTKNVERMRVVADANVGIGTSSPIGKLNVNFPTTNIFVVENPEQNDSYSSASMAVIRNSGEFNTNQYLSLIADYDNDESGTLNFGALALGASNTFKIWNPSGDDIALQPTAGNVGIGTTNPGSKLHIVGISGAITNAKMTSAGGAGSYPEFIQEHYDGTHTTPTNTKDGYILGRLVFGGHTGSGATNNRATITAVAAEDFTPTANGTQFQFWTTPNGTINPKLRMIIQNDGNVGIGASSAASKLDIVSGGFAAGDTLALTIGGDLSKTSRNNNTQKAGVIAGAHYNNTEEPSLLIASNNAVNQNLLYLGGGFSGTNAATSIQFFTAANSSTTTGTERMRITSDGNVGIGTTSPNVPLHITGGIDASLANGSGDLVLGIESGSNMVFDVNEINARNNGAESELNFQADGGDLLIHRNQASRTQVMIKDDGKVGVGTVSPNQRLHLQSDTSVAILLEADADNVDEDDHPQLRFSQDGGAVTGFIGYSESTNHLRIANEWNNANADIDIQTAGTSRLTVEGGGNVGIGTTAPSHLLHVTGVARSTQTTWATTSDKRVKTNINDLKEGLDVVMKIRPVEFEYTKKYQKFNKGYDGLKRGFIAQEVKEIIPEMVTVMEEKIGNDTIKDFHLLSNSDFTPILVKAIQDLSTITEEQQQLIVKLQTENQQLKTSKANSTEIESLRAEIEALKTMLNQTGSK